MFRFNLLFLLKLVPLLSINHDWLIIANGPFLPPDQIKSATINKKIMALDGAANKLKELEIKPDVILGDFDSIHDKDFWGIKGTFNEITDQTMPYVGNFDVLIVPSKDQDYTDLQKGILFCDMVGAKSIMIVNAIGGRLDHTLGNIGTLRKYHQKERSLLIQTETETVQYIHDDIVTFYGPIGSQCAIMAYPEAIISTTGLQYNSQNYQLNLGFHESSCNRMNAPQATVEVKGEAILIKPKIET